MMTAHPTIWIAEDGDDDFCLLNLAFDRHKTEVGLRRLFDGQETIDAFLNMTEASAVFPVRLPDLLLLDLKMPRKDGFEVLEFIRGNPPTRSLITVVLSSSDDHRDIDRAYRLGANSYVVKPPDHEGFITLARLIVDYWLRAVRRPQLNGEAYRLPPAPAL